MRDMVREQARTADANEEISMFLRRIADSMDKMIEDVKKALSEISTASEESKEAMGAIAEAIMIRPIVHPDDDDLVVSIPAELLDGVLADREADEDDEAGDEEADPYNGMIIVDPHPIDQG